MIHLRTRIMTAVAAAIAVAGCGAHDGSPGSSASQIQGGTPDDGDPSVGILYATAPGQPASLCTATLIDASVILTAAHCILPSSQASYGFYTGAGQAAATVTPQIVANMTAYDIDQPPVVYPGFVDGACPHVQHDLALLHLSAPADGLTPLAWSQVSEPPAGTECTGVGFGASSDTGTTLYGQKRSATETIVAVLDDSPNVSVSRGTGLAASGDSGGPLFCNGVMVGTTSCHEADPTIEYYSRVDQDVSGWLLGQIATWGGSASACPDGQTDSGGCLDSTDAGTCGDADCEGG
jgi:hypothetical protein